MHVCLSLTPDLQKINSGAGACAPPSPCPSTAGTAPLLIAPPAEPSAAATAVLAPRPPLSASGLPATSSADSHSPQVADTMLLC